MKTHVIYHANCWDGIVAAWVFWMSTGRQGEPDFYYHPMNHGESIPFEYEKELSKVVMLDFSLPRFQMETLLPHVDSLLVIDHHKTAQAALDGFGAGNDRVKIVFDMEESGASLTWKHFLPSKHVPDLVQYVADRDLWRFKLAYSEEINAYIQAFSMEFKSYDRLDMTLGSLELIEVASLGRAILDYKITMTKRLCNDAVVMKVGDYYVPVVNTPLLMSEVGHELCLAHPECFFGAYYFTRADGMVQWGLRSIGNFDVSEVAKKYGGGGHKNAAGFQLLAPEHYLLISGQLHSSISHLLQGR